MDAADRFLNCVLKRSERDSLFRAGAILMISVFSIALSVIIAYGFGSRWTEVVPGLLIIFCVAVLYMIYLEVRAMNLHLMRDAEWMDSLAEYAESHGLGDERARELADAAGVELSGRSVKVSKAMFVGITAFNILLAMGVRALSVDSSSLLYADYAVIAAMVIEMALASTHIVTVLSRHDAQQIAFTEALAAASGGRLEPMESSIDGMDVRPWIHLALTVATLGVYALFFNLLAVRRLNLHIRGQWAYEDGLVEAISEAVGATGIERVSKGRKRGIKRIMDAIFRCLGPHQMLPMLCGITLMFI